MSLAREIRREIDRVGLYPILYRWGSVAEYLVREWGFDPVRAESAESLILDD